MQISTLVITAPLLSAAQLDSASRTLIEALATTFPSMSRLRLSLSVQRTYALSRPTTPPSPPPPSFPP